MRDSTSRRRAGSAQGLLEIGLPLAGRPFERRSEHLLDSCSLRGFQILIGSVDLDALKISARKAEYSLTENALSPYQAEPTHLRFRTPMLDRSEQLGVDSHQPCQRLRVQRSSFRLLVLINFTCLGLATTTSWPSVRSNRLTQGECVPTSRAIRQRPIGPNTLVIAFLFVPPQPSSITSPRPSSTQ